MPQREIFLECFICKNKHADTAVCYRECGGDFHRRCLFSGRKGCVNKNTRCENKERCPYLNNRGKIPIIRGIFKCVP